MSDINILAVILSVIAIQALGFIWYAPKVFGNAWLASMGKTADAWEKMKKDGAMTKGMALGIVSSLIMTVVLAGLMSHLDVESMQAAIRSALWLWCGFIATFTLGQIAWDQKSWHWWLITNGYQLISLLMAAAILFAMG